HGGRAPEIGGPFPPSLSLTASPRPVLAPRRSRSPRIGIGSRRGRRAEVPGAFSWSLLPHVKLTRHPTPLIGKKCLSGSLRDLGGVPTGGYPTCCRAVGPTRVGS